MDTNVIYYNRDYVRDQPSVTGEFSKNLSFGWLRFPDSSTGLHQWQITLSHKVKCISSEVAVGLSENTHCCGVFVSIQLVSPVPSNSASLVHTCLWGHMGAHPQGLPGGIQLDGLLSSWLCLFHHCLYSRYQFTTGFWDVAIGKRMLPVNPKPCLLSCCPSGSEDPPTQSWLVGILKYNKDRRNMSSPRQPVPVVCVRLQTRMPRVIRYLDFTLGIISKEGV